MKSLRFTILLALAVAGCSALGTGPSGGVPAVREGAQRSAAAQDLYIGNVLGGVLLYSTGKNPQQVGDITDELPRVTSVWVDQSGVLYAFTDYGSYPYETIEEFQAGASTPSFSLVLKHYGSFAAADAHQNVYAQGENGAEQQVIDLYPPGSQSYTNEYVLPSLGGLSAPAGMAFDSSGALLVGEFKLTNNHRGQIGEVFRLDGTSGAFENLNLQKAYGGMIATDAAGDLYVGGSRFISVYSSGATSPSRIVHTQSGIRALTAASNGTLYVDMGSEIAVYPPGKSHPRRTFAPQAQVSGLALSP